MCLLKTSKEMKFDKVLKFIEEGYLAFRKSWNGQKAIWQKPSCVVKSEWCKDPILKHFADLNGGEIYAQAVMCMCVNDDHNVKSIITGCVLSVGDMLADDWEIIYNEESK